MKVLSISMALALFSSSALARIGDLSVSIERQQVTTVFYSRSASKALVGLISPQGEGYFAECMVPPVVKDGGPERTVSLEDLVDCERVPKTSYLPTEETVARINTLFPLMLERNTNKRLQRALVTSGSGTAIGSMMAFTRVADALRTNAAILEKRGLLPQARLRRLGGVGARSVSIASALIAFGIMAVDFFNPPEFAPFEDEFVAAAALGVAQRPTDNAPVLTAEDLTKQEIKAYFADTYEVVKETLIEAIGDGQVL